MSEHALPRPGIGPRWAEAVRALVLLMDEVVAQGLEVPAPTVPSLNNLAVAGAVILGQEHARADGVDTTTPEGVRALAGPPNLSVLAAMAEAMGVTTPPRSPLLRG